MLRRVAQAGLSLLGLLAVLLLLVNTFFVVRTFSPWPNDGVSLVATSGRLEVAWYFDRSAITSPTLRRDDPPIVDVLRHHPRLPLRGLPVWGSIDEPGFAVVVAGVPLWLLAFVCLAWPVTSFLLARRRRGRGFAIEPLSMPLPPGAVPSPRGGEGEL